MPRKKTSLAAKARYQNQFREHSNNSDHLEIDLTVENDDYSTSSEETEIEIVAFDDLDDEAIPVMKEKLKNSWNEVGNNFYHQGLGTSRSSVKAREKKERDKLQEANKLRKITDFLRPPETITVELSDNDVVDNDEEDVVDNFADDDGDIAHDTLSAINIEKDSMAAHFSSYQAAFEYLSSHEGSVHRNVAKNKKLDMDLWNHTAALAICSYLQMMAAGRSMMKASIAVAAVCFHKSYQYNSYKATCIRAWGKCYLNTGKLPTYRQGLHAKTHSIITEEYVRNGFSIFLRSLKDEERTPDRFMQELNNTLLRDIPHAPSSVSAKTARRWMRSLYYCLTPTSKGYYTDNHNRVDVIKYRDEIFLPLMAQYESRMIPYKGDTMEIDTENLPELKQGEKYCVLCTHDESTFYSNEGKKEIWTLNGVKSLKPKGKGQSLMISGFVCQCHGFMKGAVNVDGVVKELSSFQLFKAGVNREGWFTNADLIKQYKTCLPLIEQLHPDMDLLFAFDNSMTHHARPPDGLDAALITLGDGGKNTPAMKETWFINADGCRVTQSLQYAIQPGQPKAVCKGIKTILTERGLWTNDMNLTSARVCLASQPDFLAQGEWLREAVEGAEHHIIFYPKYHCELNWIEMVWAHLKAHLRRHCTYSFKDLESKLPVAIADEITPCLAKKLQRYAFRFMSGYREGLEGPLLDYTMKRYKGHRCIPKGVQEQMKADYETHLGKKTKRS